MKKIKNSENTISFIILTFLTITVSVLDTVFTYTGSPDLSREANPIVYTFGFGWVGLIISNFILIGIFIIASYYSFIVFKPDIYQCNNVKEYFSMLCFKRPDKFTWAIYKIPTNKRIYSYTIACIGYTVAFLIPIVRLRAVLEWLLFLVNVNYFNAYCDLISKISFNTAFGRFDYILMVILLVFILMFYWFYKQYKINKEKLIEHI